MTVLSLDEIKEHLNITDTAYDDELEGFIAAAEAIIAERVGLLEPTTITSVIESRGRLVLPAKPIVSVTSATATSGVSYVGSGLSLDSSTGEVTTSDGYALPNGRYSVTYEAGYAELPASLLLAVKEMVRHLWRSQRGGTARPGSQTQDTAPSYLIPYYIQGLIQPHQKYRLGFI